MSIAPSSVSASQWSAASSVPLRPFSDCYAYQPIENDTLRLLYLYPPGQYNEVQCRMVHVKYSEKPMYEALSYAWGSPEKPSLIAVDGIWMRVGRNLWNALRALQPPPGHSPRCLWVDALCINQGNQVETFREVQKMVPIYAGASRVICWLENMAYAEDMAPMLIHAVTTFLGKGNPWDAQQSEKFVDFLSTNDLTSAVYATRYLFSDIPYWKRVWIRQELICAATIVIQYGRHTIKWEDAAKTCAAIDYIQMQGKHGSKLCYGDVADFRHFRWIHTSRWLFSSVKGPDLFLEQLVACRNAAATDPRDKVYGLFGLFGIGSEADSGRLTANYAFGLVEVCMQAFQYCVFNCRGKPRSDHCLDILCSCRIQPHGNSDIPSWLPDWSQDATSAPISPKLRTGISASIGRSAEIVMHSDCKLLRCKGIHLSAINHIGRCLRISGFEGSKSGLKTLQNWCDMTSVNLGPNEGWHRLLSILWLGHSLESCNPEHSYMRQAMWTIWRRIRTFPWLYYRRLAVSDDSRLLLVPEEARKGDCICVIYGCSIPILLRGYDKETFQVVGDCYVEGYMDGEAIQARNEGKLRSSEFTLR